MVYIVLDKIGIKIQLYRSSAQKYVVDIHEGRLAEKALLMSTKTYVFVQISEKTNQYI